MDTLNLYKQIYTDIFCKTYLQSYYIFLCGGTEHSHIRNSVRNKLETKHFKIFYPEDLFMDLLNKHKKSDLMEFENLLADNSDAVCIICESIGSAVEFGIFSQNPEISKKMIVAIENKHSKNKSFITMGPLKQFKKNKKHNVITYKNNDIDKLCDNLEKSLYMLHKKKISSLKNMSFDNLATYIAFLLIIIFFFQTVKRKEFFHNIKNFLKEENFLPSEYMYGCLFDSAIKYLLKDKSIKMDYRTDAENILSLSDKGYIEVKKMLETANLIDRTILLDRIRCAILMEQLNRKNRSH